MKTFLAVLGIIVVFVIGAAVFVWSGAYNIAATDPHWSVTFEIIEKMRDRSIVVHSRSIIAPSVNDPKPAQDGAEHYHHACRLCHGAPGYSRSGFAKGLYPFPPQLTSDEAREWKNEELFWIIKNGLKMTGMPSFGVTHRDEELWETVAFLRRLPKMKEDEYEGMIKSDSTEEDDDHSHE